MIKEVLLSVSGTCAYSHVFVGERKSQAERKTLAGSLSGTSPRVAF